MGAKIKTWGFVIVAFLAMSSTRGQSELIKRTIDEIPFSDDTIKSVFDWITDNIAYDTHKLQNMEKGRKPRVTKVEDRISTVLKRKKGVCQHYSELFDAIVADLGYESVVVVGYSKKENEKLKRSATIGHAWNAIKVDGHWRLYDATWGAGYVSEKKNKFVKKYFSKWFDVDPKDMIKTHMPYDPMWQLLENPISYSDFDDNNIDKGSPEKMDYNRLIDAYQKSSTSEKMLAATARSAAMGDGFRLVKKWRSERQQVTGYNGANEIMREANTRFKAYFTALKSKFSKAPWNKEYALKELKEIRNLVDAGITQYSSIKTRNKERRAALNKTKKNAKRMLADVDKQIAFLKKRKF